MQRTLLPHPDSRSSAVSGLDVTLSHHSLDALTVAYRVTGSLDDLIWPAARQPARADELWHHTCFEVFLSTPDNTSYYEFNFAPTLLWAAYQFETYRKGMKALEGIMPPHLETQSDAQSHLLTASLNLNGIAQIEQASKWRLGVSAIIEETNGQKSYWALAHPKGKPDFHHSDCFTLELGAQERI